MIYNPKDWVITVNPINNKGMCVACTRSNVKFEYLLGNIVIIYGEEKTQIKNRDVIISIIELL